MHQQIQDFEYNLRTNTYGGAVDAILDKSGWGLPGAGLYRWNHRTTEYPEFRGIHKDPCSPAPKNMSLIRS